MSIRKVPIIGAFFSGSDKPKAPKINLPALPAPTPPPPPPQPAPPSAEPRLEAEAIATDAERAAGELAATERRKRGRRASILTSGQGAQLLGQNIKKTVLGA